MRIQAIQSILASNPNALFHISMKQQGDYYDRETKTIDHVVGLHFHPEYGHLMASFPLTEEKFRPKPMRIETRHVVKPYEG
jgi:hypothetical protein